MKFTDRKTSDRNCAKISRDRVQIPCLLNIKSKKCCREPNTVTKSNFPLYWSTTNLGNIQIYFSKLDSSLACAIAPTKNRENDRLANVFTSEIHVIFPSNIRYDANESHDRHAMIFRWLKKKFSFVNGKRLIAAVLHCKFRSWETIGRKKISSGIFSLPIVCATLPFPLLRWEWRALLNQYEQYFWRLQRVRACMLFLLQRTHSIDCRKNLHYWCTVFA